MRALALTCVLSFAVLTGCGGSVDNGGSGGSGAKAGSGGSGGSAKGGAGGTGAQAGSGGTGAFGGFGGSTGGFGGSTGGFGGSTGGIGGVAGFGGGTGGAPCDALAQAYTQTLAQAKVCNPFIDMNQCTVEVQDQLPCPCGPTYVNAGNQQALGTLKQLEAQWMAQQCFEGIGCPAIACETPAAGVCQTDPSGASGVCTDMFMNGG